MTNGEVATRIAEVLVGRCDSIVSTTRIISSAIAAAHIAGKNGREILCPYEFSAAVVGFVNSNWPKGIGDGN